MKPPSKPFPTYKWRWLSVQPSEGLIRVPVFLGVLRALEKFEGEPFSSGSLHESLKQVKIDTRTDIDLARTPERNLFRNSGQYWRGTGLLTPLSGKIELTPLGKKVASGDITHDEFVALMIRNTVLPNPKIYSNDEITKWSDAGLRIKPFELILCVMNLLRRRGGAKESYLTANELIRVIIPLVGDKKSTDDICSSVEDFRTGALNTEDWPNCAPEANDPRLAREFLLFLESFEICKVEGTGDRYEQRFVLEEPLYDVMEVVGGVSFFEDESIIDEEIAASRESSIPVLIERRRVSARVLKRPGQMQFRREVLLAANDRCLLTNETTPDVLEAAHIIPVEHGGTDNVGNGLCLRVDIHRLYDAGKIRVDKTGTIWCSDQIKTAISYSDLPYAIKFPVSVLEANIEWRKNYL